MNNANYLPDVLMQSDEWGKVYNDANLEFIFLDKNGSVENTVNKFIEENNIDVLAIVKRNRSFFDRLINSSLSNKFVFHSEIPIWVFHEKRDN